MTGKDPRWSWESEEDAFGGGNSPLAEVTIDGVVLRTGDRVRLRPKGQADAFDLLLAGRTAAIESIEQDYEGRIYVAVTVDDDPGKDFGQERRPAHRFFYSPEEVEPLAEQQESAAGAHGDTWNAGPR